MDELILERILRCVECVPPGWAVTYGDIAALVGTGPRQVGAAMSSAGVAVAWWRVVNASGRLPAGLALRARAHWSDEGFLIDEGGAGIALGRHRMDADELGRAYAAATADLPS